MELPDIDPGSLRPDPVYMHSRHLWQLMLAHGRGEPSRLGQGMVDGLLQTTYDNHPIHVADSLPAGQIFSATAPEVVAHERRQAQRREAEKRWIRENAPLRPIRR